MACIQSEQIEKSQLRTIVVAIAARIAIQLGKQGEAEELIRQILVSRLSGMLAYFAIRMKAENEGDAEAFEFAKLIVAQGDSEQAFLTAAKLTHKLGRIDEFQEFIRDVGEENDWSPHIRREMERYGYGLEEPSDRKFSPRARRARRREN